MSKLFTIVGLLVSLFTFAQEQQPTVVPPPSETSKLALDERFQLMKSKGQSYNDYKVIKEVVLDGVWKITKDSIREIKSNLKEASARIAAMENEVKVAKESLGQKEASVADITFDSTHINVLGISFTKSAFLIIVTITLIVLVIGLLALWGTLNYVRTGLKEKTAIVDLVNNEFDEYKRKALDKESKILRQLQDERNKYHASPR